MRERQRPGFVFRLDKLGAKIGALKPSCRASSGAYRSICAPETNWGPRAAVLGHSRLAQARPPLAHPAVYAP